MNVTVYLRDVLLQTQELLKQKYAGYRIEAAKECRDSEMQGALLKDACWHGPYDHYGFHWEFVLVKLSADWQGPNRLELSVHPQFDIIFADHYPEVFSVEVGFRNRPVTDNLPILIEGSEDFWDLYIFYDAAFKDL